MLRLILSVYLSGELRHEMTRLKPLRADHSPPTPSASPCRLRPPTSSPCTLDFVRVQLVLEH